jgi:hypothetical protein
MFSANYPLSLKKSFEALAALVLWLWLAFVCLICDNASTYGID